MKTKVLQDDPRTGADGACVIRTVGLTKRYGDVQALVSLALDVPRNSVVGLLGPNGAGKTTAIKLLLGLVRPTAGTASIFGLDTVRDSLAIRARVGYLAQDPRFYPHLTARETLEFTARFFYRGPRSAIAARVGETLELVDLADRADRPVAGLSGGERQRLGIAQAQVNHPELLILDEPAAALDPRGRRDVLEIMTRLRAQTTVFYSTHILDDVQRVSDRVVILQRGRLIEHAPTTSLLDDGSGTYEITVRGDGVAAAHRLGALAGVREVRRTGDGGSATLTVQVGDLDVADALLPAVLNGGDTVEAFGRRRTTLEDAFLRRVEGERP
jgi:ABC-2 type transport system ATP-binding protein